MEIEFLPGPASDDAPAGGAPVVDGGVRRAIQEALNEPIDLETRRGIEQAIGTLTRLRRQLDVATAGAQQITTAPRHPQGNLLDAQEQADRRVSRPEQPSSPRPSTALQIQPNTEASPGNVGGVVAAPDGFPGTRVVSLLQQAAREIRAIDLAARRLGWYWV